MSTDEATILTALRTSFGFDRFRLQQRDIIDTLLRGDDSLVLMPTGGGKSLCYQLPALLLPGITVVVSPLIALMKDQVDRLNAGGIGATFINSSLSTGEIAARVRGLEDGRYRLLYLAPERLVTAPFLRFLETIDVSLFAIDEAHCISEWGHDFREDYRALGVLRARFPAVPIVAMTATANERTRHDIIQHLGLNRNLQLYVASFDRPNLVYAVVQKLDTWRQVAKFVQGHRGQSGIVYCGTRVRCEEAAAHLSQQGLSALPYHAGLDTMTRTRVQERFMTGEVHTICATIAFGMGIDKPDIRFVVHADLPKNMMGFYQETGRAGRDGLPSQCLLLYGRGDRSRIEFFNRALSDPMQREIAGQYLDEMVRYAESGECRRRLILRHFGESCAGSNCGACDNCRHPRPEGLPREGTGVRVRRTPGGASADPTIVAQKLLSCITRVARAGHEPTVVDVVGVLTGSHKETILAKGLDSLPTYAKGTEMSRTEWREHIGRLVTAGFLARDLVRRDILSLTERGVEWLGKWRGGGVPAGSRTAGVDEAGPETANDKSYDLDVIRQEFPNAYRPWSPADDRDLALRIAEGWSVAELCTLLERQPGGVRSRIKKLGLG